MDRILWTPFLAVAFVAAASISAMREPGVSQRLSAPPTPVATVGVVISGRVSPIWGEIRVTGCGDSVVADSEGRFTLVADVPGPCSVQAEREDGAFVTYGPPVTIDPKDVQLLWLGVSNDRTGGLGVSFDPSPSGAEVLALFEGGGAERAGLRRGDRIVEIDGRAVGRDDDVFRRYALGAVGTTVEVVVVRDGERKRFLVERGLVE